MNYLVKNDEMQETHKRSTIRVVSDNLELHTIPPVESVDETYRCIVEALTGKDEYDLVCLMNVHPLIGIDAGIGLRKFSCHIGQ